MAKTINILGDTQREQWHTVVNMLRLLGGDMDAKGRSALCDEIDRYIDFCEDTMAALSADIEELEKRRSANG